jgi:uncharacterized protein (DUF2267 family)
MEEQKIAAAVSGTAGMTDREHASSATRATVAVLRQRVAGDDASFGVEEFYRRVADEEGRGCTPDGAREHARAVVAELKARGQLDDLAAELPDDYQEDLLSTAPADEQR